MAPTYPAGASGAQVIEHQNWPSLRARSRNVDPPADHVLAYLVVDQDDLGDGPEVRPAVHDEVFRAARFLIELNTPLLREERPHAVLELDGQKSHLPGLCHVGDGVIIAALESAQDANMRLRMSAVKRRASVVMSS